MSIVKGPIFGVVSRFAARLRFPWLLALTASVFLGDLLIPDLLPFVDEILLGLGTLLFASWKRRSESRSGTSVIDGELEDRDGPGQIS